MDSSDPPQSSNTTVLFQSVPADDEGVATSNGNGDPFRHALLACIMGMAVNFVIAFLKLGVHFFISRSAALFSEGLHSLGDSINSIMLLVGIVRGNRMPDRTHPFGYGLEANFWALFASFILFISAAWAVMEGVQRFNHPVQETDYFWAISVLVLSMVFEVYAIWSASRAVLSELEIEASIAGTIPKAYMNVKDAKVPTTRYVFFEDTMAFLGAFTAFVALVGSQWALKVGWMDPQFQHYPDAVASIIIGIMLLVLAFNLFLHNKGILVGAAAPAMVEQEIRKLVLNLYGVSQVHDLKTVDQGHSGLIIHMTVEVEPDTPVKDVDDLTERIKDKLSATFRNVRRDQVFIEVLADETEFEWGAKFEKLLVEGRQEGVLQPRDEALLRQAYDFTELVVRDVMIPRPDVDYVTLETSLEEVADRMIESGHTRWPIFRQGIDDLLGIVHSRDVFRALRNGGKEKPLSEIIRDIDIYPENKAVSDLLEDFKRKKLRMAAVADEHGSFAGIVTIEDLMEEIVGEIWDEHEVEEQMLMMLSPNRVLVSGKYNIEDLNEQLPLNFPTDEFVTIGGFVFGLLGREPEKGDQVNFEDLTLTVDQVAGPRIVTILIESPGSLALSGSESAAKKEASDD